MENNNTKNGKKRKKEGKKEFGRTRTRHHRLNATAPNHYTKETNYLICGKCIYHGLCNLFFGVLHGMLFCCFISGRLYIFELFSFIFIRVLRPSLRPQNYV